MIFENHKGLQYTVLSTPTSYTFSSYACCPNTAVFQAKYNSKMRGDLKDLELQTDLVHDKPSGASCGKPYKSNNINMS